MILNRKTIIVHYVVSLDDPPNQDDCIYSEIETRGLNTEDRANTIGIITLLVEKKPTGSDCSDYSPPFHPPSPPLQATIPNQTRKSCANEEARRG